MLPLIGTGTAMIGDPTGRTTSRPVLSEVDVIRNAGGIEESIRRALGGLPVEVIRNGDWIGDASLVGFLREIGSRIPLSHLLAQDSVKSRLGDVGISFLEACYPLLQAWDFWKLSSENPVMLQIGGSDQWGNVCMGLELISRSGEEGRTAFGLTHPLLTHANGTKMGKSTGGAIWLNPSALDDFGFYQFWRTLPDADVPKIARMLSDLDVAIIEAEESGGMSEIENLKAELAFSMTHDVRGETAAKTAETASNGRGSVATGLPAVDVTALEADDLPSLMVKAGLAESKSAARRLAAQGGLRVNGKARLDLTIHKTDIIDGVIVLSAGKTKHCAIRFTPGPDEILGPPGP